MLLKNLQLELFTATKRKLRGIPRRDEKSFDWSSAAVMCEISELKCQSLPCVTWLKGWAWRWRTTWHSGRPPPWLHISWQPIRKQHSDGPWCNGQYLPIKVVKFKCVATETENRNKSFVVILSLNLVVLKTFKLKVVPRLAMIYRLAWLQTNDGRWKSDLSWTELSVTQSFISAKLVLSRNLWSFSRHESTRRFKKKRSVTIVTCKIWEM